ncbi:MAG: flagellar motor protein [Clostridiales bacterium]|jgi:chemotaxis protein MotB|nr:flagellar motor protein [Clostridiales bacterium]
MSKEKLKVEKDTAERWLLTYADLMNLLLIFFIILYSMSQVDSKKFDQLSESMRSTFGAGAAAMIGASGSSNSLIQLEASAPSSVIPSKLEEIQMEEVKEKVSDLIEQQNLKGNVKIAIEERGIVISITAQLLFLSGSSQVEPNARPTIEEIGKILLAIPGNNIKVEGHTDIDPIKTSQYPSNWELSSARATNVVRLLIDKAGINPEHISAVGYGEHRPIHPNDTEVNKAANRRVDIVIVKSQFDKAEAGNSKKP